MARALTEPPSVLTCSREAWASMAPDLQTCSRLPSTLSWMLRYYLPEIAKIFRVEPMPRNRVQHQKGLSDDAFERLYPDEKACRKAWFAWRWPEGFKCPRCAGSKYCEIRERQLLQCRRCRHQTSLIAGTVLQGHQAADAGVVPRHASARPGQERAVQYRVGAAPWDLHQGR